MKQVVAVVVLCALALMVAADASAATTLMIDPDGAAGFWDQDGRQNAASFTVNSTITVTRLGSIYPRALSGDEFIEIVAEEFDCQFGTHPLEQFVDCHGDWLRKVRCNSRNDTEVLADLFLEFCLSRGAAPFVLGM